MTASEIKRQAAIDKAKHMRYKKPLVNELNLEEMRMNLSEMDEACSNVRWYLGKEVDELDELLGEDDAFEFQGSFTSLAVDIERIQEQFDDIWIPEYFDDFMAAVHLDGTDLSGYDAYEDDYFRLDTFESEAACREAEKRISTRTKREIIQCAHTVIGIICQYMSVKYRFDSLSAVFDVLMERSETQLRAVREIEEAYAAAEKVGFDDWYPEGKKLNALLRELPDRYWIE